MDQISQLKFATAIHNKFILLHKEIIVFATYDIKFVDLPVNDFKLNMDAWY